jgi:hypothetical protein
MDNIWELFLLQDDSEMPLQLQQLTESEIFPVM